MEIEFYNILKSGNYEKMRATHSMFNERRRIVVYNPFAKELWQLNGSSLDSEIIRLTDYAMDRLKKDLKVRHRVKVLKPEDSKEKFDYLLNLAKNPELAESEAQKPAKKTAKKAPKKTVKKEPKKTKKKPAVKKVTKKSKLKEEVVIEEPELPKSPPKKVPRAESSSVPQIKLPTPSQKSNVGIAKGDIDDEDGNAVKMVEEFQIAYYDASGGSNLLIEELENSISEGEGHDSLVAHIKLINELVKSKSSHDDARNELQKSVETLADVLFPKKPAKKTEPKPVKKPAKKVTKKTTKKTTKKSTKKKATKKAKKSTKK